MSFHVNSKSHLTTKTFLKHNAAMANKVGRPGMGRAKDGLIRASIRPDLKADAEALAQNDVRWRSTSHVIETAVAHFLAKLKLAGGKLDENNFPLVESDDVPVRHLQRKHRP